MCLPVVTGLWSYRVHVVFAIGLFSLCSCTGIGPNSISAGRGDYAEVINRTEDEQILNVIVRERYDETYGMITVAAVTANLRFRTQSSANIGIGDGDGYEGNLVPLSAGVGYEENPTISYIPLSGEDFTRRMMTPVSIDEWWLLGSQAKRPGYMLDLATRRINGLQNSLNSGKPPSPGFARLTELFAQLRRAGVIDNVQIVDDQHPAVHYWDFHDYASGYGDTVQELLDLLGVVVKVTGKDFHIPLQQNVGRSASAINIDTRSAFDVLSAFGNGVDIPKAHLDQGIVDPLKHALSQDRHFIEIRSSRQAPKNATVKIFFRDHWYYIDATDTNSKRAFNFLRTLMGIRLADPGADQRAPVITIPVN